MQHSDSFAFRWQTVLTLGRKVYHVYFVVLMALLCTRARAKPSPPTPALVHTYSTLLACCKARYCGYTNILSVLPESFYKLRLRVHRRIHCMVQAYRVLFQRVGRDIVRKYAPCRRFHACVAHIDTSALPEPMLAQSRHSYSPATCASGIRFDMVQVMVPPLNYAGRNAVHVVPLHWPMCFGLPHAADHPGSPKVTTEELRVSVHGRE